MATARREQDRLIGTELYRITNEDTGKVYYFTNATSCTLAFRSRGTSKSREGSRFIFNNQLHNTLIVNGANIEWSKIETFSKDQKKGTSTLRNYVWKITNTETGDEFIAYHRSYIIKITGISNASLTYYSQHTNKKHVHNGYSYELIDGSDILYKDLINSIKYKNKGL